MCGTFDVPDETLISVTFIQTPVPSKKMDDSFVELNVTAIFELREVNFRIHEGFGIYPQDHSQESNKCK